MSDLGAPIALADMAYILGATTEEMQRLTARGVLHANASGEYPLRTSIRAYVRHWVDLVKKVRRLLDSEKVDSERRTMVSAEFLAEQLMLNKDEVSNYALAGVFPCDDDGRFPLLAALHGFSQICAERMAGVSVGRAGEA